MGKDKKSRHGKNIAVTPELMEILKNFIRTKGEAYLSDPNISSIGIGYKITDKETTSDPASVSVFPASASVTAGTGLTTCTITPLAQVYCWNKSLTCSHYPRVFKTIAVRLRS